MGISFSPISSISPGWSGAPGPLVREKQSVPSNPALAGTASLADLRGAIAKVASGKSLTQDEAAEAFDLIMSGSATPALPD